MTAGPDPKFYETLTPLSAGEAAAVAGAKLVSGDPSAHVRYAAEVGAAKQPGALIYIEGGDTRSDTPHSEYGLCLTGRNAAAPSGGAVAIAENPKLAFAVIAARLHRSRTYGRRASLSSGAAIDETAWIDETAEIAADVRIGPNAVIGPGVRIGSGAEIGAGVVISHAILGNRTAILPGAKIGQAGFGFASGPDGPVRFPQLGRVLIGDEVEIGANTTIDRGALGDTAIGDQVKIDNLVQIGHNVRIGRGSVIAAQTGISGSCVIGEHVMMGGQVGLADHLTIGAGARIAASAGLMRDVPSGETWGGTPARPIREWLRETAMLSKLAGKKKR